MSFNLLPHSFFVLPDGGKLRYALFDTDRAARGTVLAVPGRREFIEKKHFELAENLLQMGFRLIIVEPRGQGLSSRYLSGDARQRDHAVNFSNHLNDLRSFYSGFVQSELVGSFILHGHSMGGHLLLRWLAEDHPPVDGVFITAPMLAISNTLTHLLAHVVSWAATMGNATHYALGQHNFGEGNDLIFENNVLTQDPLRFPMLENYFTAHPDLTVGGVTWGWLWAALRSMDRAHAWGYLQSIDVPVLALVGERDQVTPASQIAQYMNRMPRVQSHIIPNARHDLLTEIEIVRKECWGYISEFLTRIG
jgi:lysophospholipase